MARGRAAMPGLRRPLTAAFLNRHPRPPTGRTTVRPYSDRRGLHEHVVRDEEDFDRIARYIVTNPERWETDAERPGS